MSARGTNMIVDLQQLEDGRGRLEGAHDVEFIDALGEKGVVACRVEIEYNHTGNGWYFDARLSGDYATACHNCLDQVTIPVSGEFELAVRKSGDPGDVEGQGDGTTEYIVLSMGQHEVPLGPFIHENFVVNIPMIIRCRDDCKGLCATCGVNRNKETCDCEPVGDPRWGALRDNAAEESE